MAQLTIGLGFMPTLEQEEALRKAAAAYPNDWAIELCDEIAIGIWSVRFLGPGLDKRFTYGPKDVDNAIRLLQNERLKQLLMQAPR
jgi:hypothetical protein